MLLAIPLSTIALAAGSANARIDEAFDRITRQETYMTPNLEQIQRDINEIKVKVAETARDVQWLKAQESVIND